jgi:hypothetical protein
LDITVIFENLPRVSNSPLGEKSPNLVTLISTLDFVPGGKIRLVNQVCGKKNQYFWVWFSADRETG